MSRERDAAPVPEEEGKGAGDFCAEVGGLPWRHAPQLANTIIKCVLRKQYN